MATKTNNNITEVHVWKGLVQRAEQLQSQQHDEWNKAISLLDCKYFDKHMSRMDERVEVNFVNWYISNLIPLIYFRDPFIFVKSKTDDWQGFAETLEKVANVVWKDQKLKQQFKRVILSALIQPPGWLQVGYTAQIEEDVAQNEDNKQKGLLNTLKDAIKGAFKSNKDEKLPEQMGVLNQNIKEESIFADWIPSWNVLLAPGYQLVSKMPWICHYEDVAMIDFMANPMYKNKENMHGIYKDDSFSTGKAIRKVVFEDPIPYNNIKDEITTIRLYHIWDRRSRMRMTISMMSSDYHFQGEWPYDFEGFPIEPLVFEETLPHMPTSTEATNSPYPYNVIRPILPQVIENSNARTQMSAWRRRAGGIILAQADLATEEDMNQIQSSQALQLIRVTNIQAFQMSQSPALPPQVFSVNEVIQNDLQMATNMGQIMFQPQQGQRTATQAQIAQSGLQLKVSAKQDCVEDFTVVIAKKIIQLAWQFYDREKVQELIGEVVSPTMWPDLPKDKKDRRKMINNMNIFIDAGSAAPPKDETVERKQLLDFLQFAGTLAPERLNKDEVLKAGLKRWKFEKDLDKLVITNDAGEIQAADEENGLLTSNIPCIVSPNNNHLLHLQEHAKAPPTTARDQHMLDHAKFGGLLPGASGNASQGNPQASQQAGGPQAGDNKPPMPSTNPEQQRQGIPSANRVTASVQDAGPGTGMKARPV